MINILEKLIAPGGRDGMIRLSSNGILEVGAEGTTYKDFVTRLINDGGMIFSPSRNIRTGEWVDASK